MASPLTLSQAYEHDQALYALTLGEWDDAAFWMVEWHESVRLQEVTHG